MNDFTQAQGSPEVSEEGQSGTSLSYAGDANTKPVTAKKKRRTRPLFECVEPSKQVRKLLKDPTYKAAYAEMVKNARTLPLEYLRYELYPAEANSHRGAIGRKKSRGTPFDSRLKDLRNWLIHLGPKPSPDHSAERIYRYEGYAPGNIEWAGKQKQTDNRCNTEWVEDLDGDRLTIAGFCKKHGIDYERNRKRLRKKNPWSVERVLEAEGRSAVTGDPLADWRPPPHVLAHYKPQFDKRKKRGQILIDWLIEHLRELHKKATDAGLADQAFDLAVLIAGYKADRRYLKAKRDALLYCQIRDELLVIKSPAPKIFPLPKLPQPTPAATSCKPVKVEEPKPTQEEVLAMWRKFADKKIGSGQQP